MKFLSKLFMKCPQILLDMKRLASRQDDWILRLSVPSVDNPGYMVENFLKRGTYEEVVAYPRQCVAGLGYFPSNQ